VLAGNYTMAEEELRAGAVTAFPANVPYGPLAFGAEGGTFVEIFSDSTKLQAIFLDDLDETLKSALEGMGMKPMVEATKSS